MEFFVALLTLIMLLFMFEDIRENTRSYTRSSLNRFEKWISIHIYIIKRYFQIKEEFQKNIYDSIDMVFAYLTVDKIVLQWDDFLEIRVIKNIRLRNSIKIEDIDNFNNGNKTVINLICRRLKKIYVKRVGGEKYLVSLRELNENKQINEMLS